MTTPKSKNTAARLCECIRAAQEAGQTVAAVTGQSRRMVEHYTRHVRQRARATEAQRRRTE